MPAEHLTQRVIHLKRILGENGGCSAALRRAELDIVVNARNILDLKLRDTPIDDRRAGDLIVGKPSEVRAELVEYRGREEVAPTEEIRAVERVVGEVGHGPALAGRLGLRAGERRQIGTEGEAIATMRVVSAKIKLVAALQAGGA